MSCPACGAELQMGQARCAACSTLVSPPVEGSLAPKPEPLRELPGTRKKEKSWRDEVNERVRSRRKQREEETGLPLFDQVTPDETPSEDAAKLEPPARARELQDAELQGSVDEPVADLPLRSPDRLPESRLLDRSTITRPFATPETDPTARIVELGDEEPASPPLNRREETTREAPELDEDEWPLELKPPAPESRPVERPALLSERLQAGGVDLALLSCPWIVIVYFAGRAARVSFMGLLPAWPWLASYLAFLGVAYSAYFTGTTGQTLGKMIVGLRVVDTSGQPPGYVRAFLRAIVAAAGVLAAGLGLVPMAFDPARRALHDRLFRTRVIRG
jgi:uncharacterized RDD family membrane protein YckC